MAVDREIMFILRMRNEARAEIQSFVNDIRALQTQIGAFSALPVYRGGANNGGSATNNNNSQSATGGNSAGMSELVAARIVATQERSAATVASIQARSTTLNTATEERTAAGIADRRNSLASKLAGFADAQQFRQSQTQIKDAASIADRNFSALVRNQNTLDNGANIRENKTRVAMASEESIRARGAAVVASTNEKMVLNTTTKLEESASRINARSLLTGNKITLDNDNSSAKNTRANAASAADIVSKRVIAATKMNNMDLDAELKREGMAMLNAQRVIGLQEANARRAAAGGSGGGGLGGGRGGTGSSGGGGGGGGIGGSIGSMLGGGELGNAIGGMAALAGEAFVAYEVFSKLKDAIVATVKAGDEMTSSTRRLSTALHTNMADAKVTYDAIQAGAEKAGTDINETTRNFVRFSMATKELGKTSNDVLEFTNTLQKLTVISGTSSHYANLAFVQLAEGMSIGRLQGQHFKALMSDFPAVMQALGDATGKTTGQLNEMAHAGKLTPEFLFDGITKAGAAVNKTFEGMPVTLEQAIGKASSAITRYMAEVDHKIGASAFLAKYLSMAADATQKRAEGMSDDPLVKLKQLEEHYANLRLTMAGLNTEEERLLRNQLAIADDGANGNRPNLGKQTRQNDQDEMDTTESINRIVRLNAIRNGAADATARQIKIDTDYTKSISEVEKSMTGETKATDANKLEIEMLQKALLSTDSVFVKFGYTIDQIAQRIEFLTEKTSPLAKVMAGLAVELGQVQAGNKGTLEGELFRKLEEFKKDNHGNAADPEQTLAIRNKIATIDAARGDDAIKKAVRLNQLEAARLKDRQGHTGGRFADAEKSRQDYEDNVDKYGKGQADRIKVSEDSTGHMREQANLTGAGEKVANALTDQTTKMDEAKQMLDAYTKSGAGASVQARILGESILEAAKISGHSEDKNSALVKTIENLKLKTQEYTDTLNLLRKTDDNKEAIKDSEYELTLSKLNNVERKRALDLRRLTKEAEKNASLASPEAKAAFIDTGLKAIDTDAMVKAKSTLQERLEGYKEEYALMGLSGNKLEEEKAIRQTINDLRKAGIESTSQDAKQQAEYTEQVVLTKKAIKDLQDTRKEIQGHAGAGFMAGITETIENGNNVFDKMKGLATTAFSSMGDALANFASTGKLNFASFATSIIKDMIKIAAQQALVGILKQGIGLLAGTGGITPGEGTNGYGLSNPNTTGFASGGIMSSDGPTNLRKYANGGIADSPQMALFGEGAMNEAYVPLPDGRSIPVSMKGGKGGGIQNNSNVYSPNITINMHGDAKGSDDHANFAKTITEQMNGALDARMTQFAYDQRRPGGSANPGRTY